MALRDYLPFSGNINQVEIEEKSLKPQDIGPLSKTMRVAALALRISGNFLLF